MKQSLYLWCYLLIIVLFCLTLHKKKKKKTTGETKTQSLKALAVLLRMVLPQVSSSNTIWHTAGKTGSWDLPQSY